MAVLYINGATLGGNFAGIAGRFGGLALYTNVDNVFSPTLTARDTYIHGVSVYPNAVTNNGVMAFYEGATRHVYLAIVNSKLRAYRGDGTLLGEGSMVISASAWYGIEAKVKVHDSTGTVEVRVNGGHVDINLSGIDTRNGGTAGLLDNVTLGAVSPAAQCYFSDWRVLDTTGSANNDFIGDARVVTLLPAAEGNSSDFTPSSGTDNALMVDDTNTGDDDSTYNASSTAGHKDTFVVPDLTMAAGSVKAVNVAARWRKDDGGTRVGRLLVRSGGTDYEGADVVLGSSYALTRGAILEQNPATSTAWSIADINALQPGYKLQS